jgi:hypothetical protein
MPKQRLTDRQLISGVTLTDLLHFVVTGDTSQNPAGSSYKGNVEQLFGAFSAYTCSNPLTVDVVNACTSGITINGNVVINGSADNNIVLNYSGTHLTAIGGGITLEDGVSDGVDSRIFTNSDGIWLFDPGLSASTGTIDTLSACTGVYTSNLYGCSPLHIEPSGLNDVYVVENGGNVGIGTVTPNYKLDVNGTTNISEDLFVGDTVYIGNVTGTPVTNASLYIRQPSTTGSTESPIIDIQVDDANSYFRLNNNTNTDGVFSPAILTRQADTSDRIALFIDTIVDPTYDTPGAPDVLRFRARQDSGLIQNRDLYAWYNYTTRLMDLDKDGNLDIIQGGLRINTVGGGTPLINLGLDSSGNVVTGTTGGGTFTGNTSGDCITDLFVSNIHSCSPLNINPLDEGNVYFGSTSAVTIDLTNNRVGINTSQPDYKLDISGTTGRLFYDSDSVFNQFRASTFRVFGNPTGNTEIALVQDDVNGANGLSLIYIGTGTTNTSPNRLYGGAGDAAMFATSMANNLNIINTSSTGGTSDNIRFYAGVGGLLSSNTPDIHIQGSGATRGYIGINNENPQFTLDVAGETRLSGSGQNVLTVIGSGDTEPLFKVEGSSGELFSITDSLVGSLFSVNDIQYIWVVIKHHHLIPQSY